MYPTKKNKNIEKEKIYQNSIRDTFNKIINENNKGVIRYFINQLFTEDILLSFKKDAELKIDVVHHFHKLIKNLSSESEQSSISNQQSIISNISSNSLINNQQSVISNISSNSSISEITKNFLKNSNIKLGKLLGIGGNAYVFELIGSRKYVIRIVKYPRSNRSHTNNLELKGMDNHFILNKLCSNSVIKLKKNGIMRVKYEINITNNKKKKYELKSITSFNEYYYQVIEKGLFDMLELLKFIVKINNEEQKILFIYSVKILIICIKKIECIHNNKYLHRDVKPDNIIIIKGTEKDHDIVIEDKDLNILNEMIEELNRFKKNFMLNVEEIPKLTKFIKIRYIDFGFLFFSNNVSEFKSDGKKLGTRMYMKKNSYNRKYNYMTDLFALARIYQALITNRLEGNRYSNKRHNIKQNNYPTENIYKYKKEWFKDYDKFKELSKSIIPLKEPINKINNIICLEGKNRTQSYKSMIDVFEKILILINNK